MLRVHFIDTEAHEFSEGERSVVESMAAEAAELAREHLPLAERLHLLVEPSTAVVELTGDNAYTMEPHLIRWSVDPSRGIAEVAEQHLKKAFLHEAYHAARFRRLRHEAGGGTWLSVAINEGLATAFARDVGDAHEPWAEYDPTVIARWADELAREPFDMADLTKWKFEHDDGREWIAFRVGTWLVDELARRGGGSAVDLVWTPVEDIEPLTRR